MRILFLCVFALTINTTILAQTTTHTYNGTSLELRTEVEGTLSLRWNTFPSEYRFFAEKDGTLYELVNTKGSDDYNREYLAVLENLTADQNLSADKVRLTLGDLRSFFNLYNTAVDPNFVGKDFFSKPEFRLGGYGGITNNPFVTNPENISNPQLGIEFEVLDPELLPRHAVVVQLEHALSSNDFDYSATQLSLNYRYKFIKSETIDVFVNSKLVTFTSFNRGGLDASEIPDTVDTDPNSLSDSGSSFQSPLLFGIGADIKLGNGYLTLGYNDAFGLFIDNNGEFPLDLSVGYKFVL